MFKNRIKTKFAIFIPWRCKCFFQWPFLQYSSLFGIFLLLYNTGGCFEPDPIMYFEWLMMSSSLLIMCHVLKADFHLATESRPYYKLGSPSMCSTAVAQGYMFLLHSCNWKKFNYLNFFFSRWWMMAFAIKLQLQLISQSGTETSEFGVRQSWKEKKNKETREKTSEFVAELSKIEEKDKIMENSYATVQIKLVLSLQRSLLRLAN